MSIILGAKLSAPFDIPDKIRAFVNGIEILFDPTFNIEYELTNNSVLSLKEVTDIEGKPIFFERFSKIIVMRKNKIIFKGITEDSKRGHFDSYRRNVIDNLSCLDWRKLLDYIRISVSLIGDKPEAALEKISNVLNKNQFYLGQMNFTLPETILKGFGIEDSPISEYLDFVCETSNSFWSIAYDPERDMHKITIHSKKGDATKLTYEDLTNTEKDIEASVWNNENLEYANSLKLKVENFEGGITHQEVVTYTGENEFRLVFGIGEVLKIEQFFTLNNISIPVKQRTFANNLEQDQGIVADFFYKIGDKVLELNEEKFNLTNLSGANFNIIYKTRNELSQYFINASETSKLSNRLGTDGIITIDKSVKYMQSNEDLISYKNNFFDTYSKPHVSLNIRSKKRLYDIGQIIEFTADDKSAASFFSVKNRTSRFIVKGISEEWMSEATRSQDETMLITYTYELTNVMNGLDHINYFDDRNIDKYINLRDSGKIIKNIQLYDNYNLVFELCENDNGV